MNAIHAHLQILLSKINEMSAWWNSFAAQLLRLIKGGK